MPLNDAHPRTILDEYVEYYDRSRSHQSLDGNAPQPRQPDCSDGAVSAIAHLGGFHHRYRREALAIRTKLDIIDHHRGRFGLSAGTTIQLRSTLVVAWLTCPPEIDPDRM